MNEMSSVLAPMELHFHAQRFLNLEAAKLDARDFRGWLNLFSDKIEYRAPVRSVRPPRERDLEIGDEQHLAYFDESFETLQMRVEKIETGRAWAEEPPSRTRHLATNVRVEELGEGRLDLRSNFLVAQYRAELDRALYFGEKCDVVETEDPGAVASWRIVKRTVLFDHATLDSPSLSIFF